MPWEQYKKQHFSSYLLSKGNKPYAVLTYTLCRILIALIHKSAGLTWIDNKKVTAWTFIQWQIKFTLRSTTRSSAGSNLIVGHARNARGVHCIQSLSSQRKKPTCDNLLYLHLKSWSAKSKYTKEAYYISTCYKVITNKNKAITEFFSGSIQTSMPNKMPADVK